MSSRWPIALASTLAVVLALASGSAAALGLGQIQVKSKPGQPLLAEIPILANDPSELQGLQVQLASPDTFRRVGLEPPQGAAASLRFEPALDASGHPVVRVTSLAPVTDPELTFLLEVDWAQGRLVREYSALIDAPRTVAATPQPIQAPVVAPPDTIERPPPAVATVPAPTPPPAAPVPATPKPVTPKPAPPATPVAPPPVASTPSSSPSPSPDVSTQAPVAPGTVYGPVRRGQTLGRIATSLAAAQDHSLAQTMLALLRANPDAFIGGNINQLKAGAVLRLPAADEFTRLDRRQAAALVHQQIVQWREARKPLPQAALAATATSRASNTRGEASISGPRATRSRDARLEIVPPSSSRAQAGGDTRALRSGTQAGGEGDMLQLQETRETLAARDAEVGELKSRVAELEKLQAQQQQLLTLKDSALAEAQQRLAAVNAKAATPAATTTAPASPAATAAAPAETGTPIWLWIGGVLVIAALIAWLLARRRPAAPVAPRRGFDTQTLAAGMVAAPATSSSGKTGPAHAAATESPGKPAGKTTGKPAKPGAATDARNAPTVPAETIVPPWHGGATENAATATTVEVEPAEPARKLEQAQAFMAMGDDDTARELLRDVLNGRDPAARDRAARLLRDL